MLIKQTKSVTPKGRRVNIAAIAIMASAPFLFAGAAHAATADETVQVIISASDLNSDAGIERVYDHLTHEAEDACDDNRVRGLEARTFEQYCIEDLVDDFVFDINNPALFARHGVATGTVIVE